MLLFAPCFFFQIQSRYTSIIFLYKNILTKWNVKSFRIHFKYCQIINHCGMLTFWTSAFGIESALHNKKGVLLKKPSFNIDFKRNT